MKVYLASRYGRREELRRYRSWLLAAGIESTSTWLDDHDLPDGVSDSDSLREEHTELRAVWAIEDMNAIRGSDLVICFTEDERTTARRGGRHAELGFALGLMKAVWIVGPRENIFCCPPWIQVFPDWDVATANLVRSMLEAKVS